VNFFAKNKLNVIAVSIVFINLIIIFIAVIKLNFASTDLEFNRSKVIKEEFLIDTHIVHVAAPWRQAGPAITFDGTNYLVVWQNKGRGFDVYESFDIYGTRVSQSGTILDPAGIVITDALNWQLNPSVAFDGTNYLVVWEDNRNGPSDIYGTRVNQRGVVIDSSGISISTVADRQGSPAVAFDGENYFVVWEDKRNGSFDIYGTRVNQSGTILDPDGVPISRAENNQKSPSITFDDENYLVVWQDKRNGSYDIYCTRVSKTGIIFDTNGAAISTDDGDQVLPTLAANGRYCFVVWSEPLPTGRLTYSSKLYGARIDQSGNVIDTTGIYFFEIVGKPKIIYTGTKYLIIWSGPNAVFLDTSGRVLSTFTVYPKGWNANVVFNGQNYFFVWEDARNGFSPYYYTDIYGARVDHSGAVLDTKGFVVSKAIGEQLHSAVTFDAANYLVVWQEHNGSSYDICGIRISSYGQVLDTASIKISTANDDQCYPAVSFDGANYFVVWQDIRKGFQNTDVYGARISQAGKVFDPSGIAISTAKSQQWKPSIAFDGRNYLVVWEDIRGGAAGFDIYGARVHPSGKILDPLGFVISNAKNHQRTPAIVFDGTNYFVVWRDERNGYRCYDIYGARVSPAGVLLDSNGIAISAAESGQFWPSVAFDGTNYLVVWEDNRNGPSDIYGTLIDTSGSVLYSSGIPISAKSNDQRDPAIAFDGNHYVVAWQEKSADSSWDICGVKINTSYIVIDSFNVSIQFRDQTLPVLIKGCKNQIFMTYSGWTDSIESHPAHQERIWGKFYPSVVK